MTESLLKILRAPGTYAALQFEGDSSSSGVLRAADGRSFDVRSGIPRFTEMEDAGQAQTRDSFGFKWARQDTYDSAASRERMGRWLVERYGFASIDDWAAHFSTFQRVLDVGCGGGLSSGTWLV